MPDALPVTTLPIYLGLGLVQGSAVYTPSDVLEPLWLVCFVC